MPAEPETPSGIVQVPFTVPGAVPCALCGADAKGYGRRREGERDDGLEAVVMCADPSCEQVVKVPEKISTIPPAAAAWNEEQAALRLEMGLTPPPEDDEEIRNVMHHAAGMARDDALSYVSAYREGREARRRDDDRIEQEAGSGDSPARQQALASLRALAVSRPSSRLPTGQPADENIASAMGNGPSVPRRRNLNKRATNHSTRRR